MKITYLNALQGVGKQSKKPWFRVQFVATAENGTMAAVEKFVSEIVYNQFLELKPGKEAVIEIGVDQRGEFTIVSAKEDSDDKIF